jgi:phage RecT family recombinase
MTDTLQRTDNNAPPWQRALTMMRENESLIGAWVPPKWAERTGRTRQAIAMQTIEAVRMQLTNLNMNLDPVSVLLATLSCLQIGLRPDGATGHAYLMPMAGKAVLCIGYKGYVALAARSGLKQVRGEVVFNGDRFPTDTMDNLSACRSHLPGTNASIATPIEEWAYGFFYGVWLTGGFTEPLVLSGLELRDRYAAAKKRNSMSYAGKNPLPWARIQMIRRGLSGGSLALVNDEYGGMAPAVLGAQIDAAGEAGKLREVAQHALSAAQDADIDPGAIRDAETLLAPTTDAQETDEKAAPRSPAELLARKRQEQDK